MVDVHPGALGEGNVATHGSLLHHGCYHHIVAPQVLVPDAVITGDVLIILIEAQRTHHGQTVAGVVVGQRVVIGQPSVALLDDTQREVAKLGVVIGLGMIGRVGAQHRREQAQLQPADVEFAVTLVIGIHGKAAHVVRHITQAAQARIEHDSHLGLETAPRAGHVGGPGEDGITLQACCTCAHHDHRTTVGIILLEHVIDDAAPLVAVVVVVLLGCQAVPVANFERMLLGLAQVAPPAGHALIGQRLVAVAQPLARGGIGHVKHATLPYPDGHRVSSVGAVGLAEDALGIQQFIIVDGTAVGQHIGLRDGHHVDALLLEIAQHAAVVGPLLLVPFQASHVLLLAIPVQVEYDAVQGIALALEGIDHALALALVTVAIFAGDVTQRPQWRQFLTSNEPSEVPDHILDFAVAIDDVIGNGLRCGGAVFNALLAQVERRLAEVVKQHAVALGRDHHRHGDAHQLGAVRFSPIW